MVATTHDWEGGKQHGTKTVWVRKGICRAPASLPPTDPGLAAHGKLREEREGRACALVERSRPSYRHGMGMGMGMGRGEALCM